MLQCIINFVFPQFSCKIRIHINCIIWSELAQCEDQYTFKLVFNGGGGRTYILATDSQESLETWMKALARASYDYLKLMVAELQKQLDELNGKFLFLFSSCVLYSNRIYLSSKFCLKL